MKEQSTEMINENARLSKNKLNDISVQTRTAESHNNAGREIKEDTESMK